MNKKGMPYSQIMKELRNAYDENYHFKDGGILGSMCTKPHNIALKAHSMFIESNLGNPGLYPGTKKLEKKVIGMLGGFLHNRNACGHVTNGGTESNITALWIAKKITKKKEVIFPESAHFSFHKACDLMDLKPVEISLDENYRMRVDEVEDKISNNTACVVGVAGTTELGVVDPIDKLSDICNGKTFLHVDAAFGGFVIPFLKELGYNLADFDFSLDSVCSITVDPHKMGMASIPAGVLLLKEKQYLKSISRKPVYLTGVQACLSGTRCSASVPGAYAVMKILGKDGYKKIVKRCMDTTFYLSKRFKEIGLSLPVEPEMNVVCAKVKNPDRIVKELDKKGWKISKTRKPKCIRIVVMPHVTRKVVEDFIPELEKVCRKLGEI
ncbi:MAG: tyrosine decarboxylase MfnA [Thermoplasmatales archaeon]|nr:tyrosine decarboxylase MfnA [Thermoplasmatales archaeon]